MIGNKELERILYSLRKEAEQVLGKNLVDIFLFGSYARGDFTAESDIDILIVVNKSLTREEKNKMSCIISALSLENEVVIAYVVYEKEFFNNVGSPLILNVKEEGVKV